MSTEPQQAPDQIGSLNEKPLHASLKKWYAGPTDQFEVSVDGYVIDIVRGDLLVEIQTRNFSAIKRKLVGLTSHHRVRLMYPIAQEKWIIKLANEGEGRGSRRKSPKRGTLDQVFEELVSFPKLLSNPNFSLLALLVQEEEVRRYDPRRGWRRKGWVTQERRLLDVVDQRLFETPQDMGALIPSELAEPFTTSDLAVAIGRPRRLAQKMAYCLREMDAIAQAGKRGNAILYERATDAVQGSGEKT
jgi:hypothetical protein